MVYNIRIPIGNRGCNMIFRDLREYVVCRMIHVEHQPYLNCLKRLQEQKLVPIAWDAITELFFISIMEKTWQSYEMVCKSIGGGLLQ